MAQLQDIRTADAMAVVRIGRALNLALAALAQYEDGKTDAGTMGALIGRARDLTDDLANAVDALPEPPAAGHGVDALEFVPVRTKTRWLGAGTA